MLYTIIWLVVWLLLGNSTFTFGNGGAFWSLVIALIVDILWTGYWNKGYIRRP
jgi:hypothetical protein